MKKILEKVSWKTRKLNISLSLINIGINYQYQNWGFDLLSVIKNYKKYSLLSFWFRLPNLTTVRNFTIDEIDFMYLRDYFHRLYDRLDDRKQWSDNLNVLESVILKILDKTIK